MISQHADAQAYRYLLAHLKRVIREHAEKLLRRAVTPRVLEHQHADLLESCRYIMENGFSPKFSMIDGDDGERNALLAEFPGMPIRACQYHFIHAVRSRLIRYLGRQEPARLTINAVLEAVRACQRCPRPELWDTYYGKLRREFEDICGEEASWNTFDAYLQAQWFSERWRALCCDYGLPPYLTRDIGANTNNYTESAFRVFDLIFLSCRVNKR